MIRPPSFLAGLSEQEFLSKHWQKRPLLVRQALPDLAAPLTAEELAGLSLSEEVEARVVIEREGGWHLQRGPFEDSFFASLPSSHWTLLVQDLDQHVPEVAAFFELLDFLPSYRLDDVMASYAVDGGSVGPHFDQYDVFLLQVRGQRRWQISEHFDAAKLRADSELCLLDDFRPEAEWLLNPGDMLYLPPHVAHFGVAVGECMTFSLGCRAPSAAEVVAHFARHAIDNSSESVRYRDADLLATQTPHALDPAAVARVRALLEQQLALDNDAMGRSFASLLTQPKALFARDSFEPLSAASVARRLKRARGFRRRKGSRWLVWSALAATYLYVDGTEFAFPTAAAAVAQQLCCEQQFPAALLRQWAADAALRALILELVACEFLEPDDESL
jgi:50S ribosomal protein L16 3-hydroxylase